MMFYYNLLRFICILSYLCCVAWSTWPFKCGIQVTQKTNFILCTYYETKVLLCLYYLFSQRKEHISINVLRLLVFAKKRALCCCRKKHSYGHHHGRFISHCAAVEKGTAIAIVMGGLSITVLL